MAPNTLEPDRRPLPAPLARWQSSSPRAADSPIPAEADRDHNKVNEITDITAPGSQPQWATPTYDANGNTTSFPKPSSLTNSYTAVYDPWNRLTQVKDGGDLVATYQYDGANRRVVKKSYTSGGGGSLDETRHFYYSDQWQVLEERTGTSPASADPERQFVWGLRYIDDLVLRDRDSSGGGGTASSSSSSGAGVLDERLYSLQDPNFNVAAVVDTAADAQERYEYEPYGKPTVLTGAFGSRASSSYDWETRYAGYRFDDLVDAYHVRNRVLHAELGRWVQREQLLPNPSAACSSLPPLTSPLATADPNDLYFYAVSAPVNAIDPLGLWHYRPGLGTLDATLGEGPGFADSKFALMFKHKWNEFNRKEVGPPQTCCDEIRFIQMYYYHGRWDSNLTLNEWVIDTGSPWPFYGIVGDETHPVNPITTPSGK